VFAYDPAWNRLHFPAFEEEGVLQVLLDMQLASIKGFNIPGFSEDTRIHVLTQRYATLTTSLLLLNADYQVRNVT
jgi:hypothetical protein